MNKKALSPKDLMISRYQAFVAKDWDYLVKTSVHQKREDFNNSAQIEWLKLDVLDAYDDIVEFKAYYKENGVVGVLHEKSKFINHLGMWKYLDGELFDSKIQRNEQCPCGSGKKYKKCCA